VVIEGEALHLAEVAALPKVKRWTRMWTPWENHDSAFVNIPSDASTRKILSEKYVSGY